MAPPGCEASLFERVLRLREARLEEAAAESELSAAAEALRRERELLGRKARGCEVALAAIAADTASFRREVQGALNQLPVDCLLDAGRVAAPMLVRSAAQEGEEAQVAAEAAGGTSNGLVFSARELQRLYERSKVRMCAGFEGGAHKRAGALVGLAGCC